MQATVRCGRPVSVDWRWTIPLTRELKVLGHPFRLAILSILNRAERSVSVCELELRLPSPTTCSGYSACWKPPVCQWPASPTTCPRPWLPGSGTSLRTDALEVYGNAALPRSVAVRADWRNRGSARPWSRQPPTWGSGGG